MNSLVKNVKDPVTVPGSAATATPPITGLAALALSVAVALAVTAPGEALADTFSRKGSFGANCEYELRRFSTANPKTNRSIRAFITRSGKDYYPKGKYFRENQKQTGLEITTTIIARCLEIGSSQVAITLADPGTSSTDDASGFGFKTCHPGSATGLTPGYYRYIIKRNNTAVIEAPKSATVGTPQSAITVGGARQQYGTTHYAVPGQTLTLSGRTSNYNITDTFCDKNRRYTWRLDSADTASTGAKVAADSIPYYKHSLSSTRGHSQTVGLRIDNGYRSRTATHRLQTNSLPIANAGADQRQTLQPGQGSITLTLDASGSHAGGDATEQQHQRDQLSYQWSAPPGVTLSDTTAARPRFSVDESQLSKDKPLSFAFSLRVHDGLEPSADSDVSSATDSHVEVSVLLANSAPALVSAIGQQRATQDTAFSLDLSPFFDDADDSDTLRLTTNTLPAWLRLQSARLSGTPANGDVGSLDITVTATDDDGETVSDTFTLTVANTNDTPTVANPIADQNATEDSVFSFTVPANAFNDVDSGDTLSLSSSALPAWLSFDPATRTFSGTPANGDVGSLDITVTATDDGDETVDDTFTLAVANTNDAPTLANAIADQDATEDSAFSFTVPANTFDDVDDGDTLSFSSSTLPAWLSFDAATRTFSGTPANGDVGSVDITVTATDDGDETVDDTFTLAVANTNDTPTVANPIADQNATEDSVFSFTVPANAFNDVDSGDTLSLSSSALPAWLSFDPATRTFAGTPANGDVGSVDITVTATDDDGEAVDDTFTLTVANANDAPTLANAIADQSATEDSVFSFTVPANAFNDVDSGDTLSLSSSTLPAWLSFDAATRTFSGTPANGDVGSLEITVTATDDGDETVDDTFTLAVANTNDTPTVANPIADQAADEDQAFSFTVPADAFTDPDVGDTLSYTISAGPAWLSVSGDVLSGTPAQGDVGSTNITLRATDPGGLFVESAFSISVAEVNDNAPVFSSTNAVSVPENTTGAVYTAAASDVDSGDTLAFSLGGTDAALFSLDGTSGELAFLAAPDFEAPADEGENNVYDLTITATDAADNRSDLSLTLTVTDLNDVAPSFTSTDSASVDEGSTATGYVAAATDPDTNDSVSYAIEGGDDAAHFDIDPGTGSLSFAQASDFESPLDSDGDNVYDVTLRARDSAGNESTLDVAITVIDANDNAPRFTSKSSAAFDENTTATGYTATATDPDSADVIAFAISGGPDAARFSIDASTGVIAAVSALDRENPSDADGDGFYQITLSATDSANLVATLALTLQVEDLNDTDPSFSSPAAVSISEDNYTVGYTALATDPDSDDAPALSLRYAISGGADQALFAIDDSTGVLSFVTAPDFEAPDDAGGDHVYHLRLEATDTADNTGSLDLAITLTDANDNAPAFSSAPTAVIPEGSTGVFYTATAIDPDHVGTIAFSITGGNDAGLFSIDSASGELSVSAVDFEAPGAGSSNNVYSLTLTITDGVNEREALLAITVEDINDNPPTITSIDALRVDENATDTGYVATATDPDTGDSLSWSFGGGADDALFSIDTNTGALSFAAAPDFENPGDAGGDNVYDVVIQASDAAGNISTLALALSVDNLNDTAPEISSADAVSIDENSSASPYTLIASDADNIGAIRYAIEGGPDAARFSIDATSGALAFDQAPDREAPADHDADNVYQLRLSATDAADHQDTLDLSITVDDLNDTAPTITSAQSVSVAEGSTATGYSASSSDPDSNDSVRYAISGTDAARFSIDASTGALSFAAAPDFENPADAGADNGYAITLSATDAADNASRIDVAVRVTDTNDEAPVFTSAANATVAEGSTAVFYAASATDADAGDRISYALDGADAARFHIAPLSGALRAAAVLDHEQPSDADGDGIYRVVLRASDAAGHADTLDLQISVADLNEAPRIDAERDFAIGEFAPPGTLLAQLGASDPEGDALRWTLLSNGSPFELSAGGELRLREALDFEQLPRYRLQVQVSDAQLSASAEISVAVSDENEIARLLEQRPLSAEQLREHGVAGAVDGREDCYEAALAAARPAPATLAALQALIARANAACEAVDGAGSGTGEDGGKDEPATLIKQLGAAGVEGLEPANARCYEQRIEAYRPPPTATAILQAIADRVDADVALIDAARQHHLHGAELARFTELLASRRDVAPLDPALHSELAARIVRREPPQPCEVDLDTLITALQARADTHPVVYLSVEQAGRQVQQLRADGGTATFSVHISNPVPGLAVRYDWAASDESLLRAAGAALPLSATLAIEPASLGDGTRFLARVAVHRNGLQADAQLPITIAATGAGAAQTRDSDGDGVSDAFDGELDAAIDPGAVNLLQTVAGDDISHLMEASDGVILRLGQTARAAQLNQATIRLDDIVTHLPGAQVAAVIEALPGAGDQSEMQVFDFEAAALPHAGASAAIVLPLKAPLRSGAGYAKYHPATGWRPFVEDGLNRLYSTHAVAGILGQCPPPGHSAWAPGLGAGHACVQLTIEDGGPNDDDRLRADGSPSADRGLNGNIVDPGAIIYTERAEAKAGEDTLQTGLSGSGAGALGGPALLALGALAARRHRRRVRPRSPPSRCMAPPRGGPNRQLAARHEGKQLAPGGVATEHRSVRRVETVEGWGPLRLRVPVGPVQCADTPRCRGRGGSKTRPTLPADGQKARQPLNCSATAAQAGDCPRGCSASRAQPGTSNL